MMPMRASIVGPPRSANQQQRLGRRLPFRRLVLGLWKLGDIVAGILQRDGLAAAGHRNRIIEGAPPALVSRQMVPAIFCPPRF
jgi:hypothetical protein